MGKSSLLRTPDEGTRDWGSGVRPNPQPLTSQPASAIASAADFRAAFEAHSEAVRLVLPKSGLPVLARRLSPMRVMLTSQRFGEIVPTAGRAETIEYARLVVSTIQQILAQPRLALNPGPEEIDPNWLPQEDSAFLLQWGMGGVADDGTDLAQAFRQTGERLSAPGANGGGLRDAAEQLRRDSEPDSGAEV